MATFQMRCYFLPYEKNWSRLKSASVPASGETAAGGLARRALFRNAVLSNLAHLRIKPGDRSAIFQALVNHVVANPSPGGIFGLLGTAIGAVLGGRFNGLESVYLTLIADPMIRALPQYAESIKLWNGSAPGPLGNGADTGAVFYNEAGDRLSLLSPATVRSLKAGGAHASFVSSGASLATNIESIAYAIINKPFSKGPVISAPTRVRRADATPSVSPQVQAQINEMNNMANVFAFVGVMLSAFPPTEIFGAACLITAAGIKVAAVLTPYLQDLTPTSSVEITVDGTPPPQSPVSSPDGTPQPAFSGEPPDDGGAEGWGGDAGGGGGDAGDGDGGDGGDGCFIAGTPVLMGDGSWKDIADISAGDQVIWFDQTTGKQGKAAVIAVYAYRGVPTWRATFDDGWVLYTTARQQFHDAEHQVRVATTQLIAGRQLAALGAAKNIAQRKVVGTAQTGQKQTVYDLKVEAPHTFTVGRGNPDSILAYEKE